MIRKAKREDATELFGIYEIAKGYMRKTGNPNQWGSQYPPREEFMKEIDDGVIYVLERENPKEGQKVLYGVFELLDMPDPTYAYIEGSWKSDTPYGTIHRVASDGSEKGVFSTIVTYARERHNHLRIDTHEQNLTMQHVIRKHGFEYCGTIYLANGDARRAYEWVAEEAANN